MGNKLQLTLAKLDTAKSLKELVDMPEVHYNAISNLMKTRGINENQAAMVYEREKILFASVKNLDKCTNFSKYSAWIQLFASGRTLLDGDSYIVAYGTVAQFQIGWKGRLAQMGEIPEIINIPPPQVVYDNDDFAFELGENPRIIKHVPAKTDKGNLAYVYLVIHKKSGNELHIMDRNAVLAIRDRYSKSYQQYISDCNFLKKEIGSTFKKHIEANGGFDVVVEPPMWVSSEEQAWKKTLVKRAYGSQKNKTPRMKAVDAAIEDNANEEQVEDISYGIVDDKQLPPPPTPEQTPTPEPQKVDLQDPSISF